MRYRFIRRIGNTSLILSLTLLVFSLSSLLPSWASGGNSRVTQKPGFKYEVYDPDKIYCIKVITTATGQVEGQPIYPSTYPTSYTVTIGHANHEHTLKITDYPDCNRYTDTWKIAAGTGAPSYVRTDKACKKQTMTFIAPFNLTELKIPGTVTFNLPQENMISHSLVLAIPERLGKGNASLGFISGYGEIFFNYGAYDPYVIIFNITQWVMKYSGFSVLGRSTGQNTAVTDPTSYGSLNVTSGEMTVFETGTYTNDIYKSYNPIEYSILYSGFANFTSNTIYLDGMGAVEFPETAPVGGFVVPVDKFGLLAPYIGIASTIVIASVAFAIYVKRVKHRNEKQ